RRIYQTCAWVPLIVRGPGIAPGRTDTPARVLDVGVTLLALAGLTVPEGMLGRNLLDPAQPAPTARFIETYGGAVPNLPGAKALMADQPPMRTGLVQDGWKLILDDDEAELYNLQDDPREERNRAEEEPERTESMRALLEEFDRNVDRGVSEEAPLS